MVNKNLTACKTCGQPIAKSAEKCPHCGGRTPLGFWADMGRDAQTAGFINLLLGRTGPVGCLVMGLGFLLFCWWIGVFNE